MKIILINGSSVPLYEQIKNAIKENILKNKVKEGEQLPSVRTLSKDLKVSILTVKKAYDEAWNFCGGKRFWSKKRGTPKRIRRPFAGGNKFVSGIKFG